VSTQVQASGAIEGASSLAVAQAPAATVVGAAERERAPEPTPQSSPREQSHPGQDPIRILGLVGSLRRASYNRGALRAAEGLMPPGATLQTFEIGDLPGFNQDQERDPPQRVVELKRAIRAADGLLFVTPEYNYSVPGVLKNAIDWASRPYGDSAWKGKPAAIMGASVGAIGTARAQYHLRQMFVFLDVLAINQPEVMIGKAEERFDREGNLTDDSTKQLIAKLLASLVSWTRRLKSIS